MAIDFVRESVGWYAFLQINDIKSILISVLITTHVSNQCNTISSSPAQVFLLLVSKKRKRNFSKVKVNLIIQEFVIRARRKCRKIRSAPRFILPRDFGVNLMRNYGDKPPEWLSSIHFQGDGPGSLTTTN